ncbi:lysophospholipid acyltransferase family protein [Calderihabitans maritimus]|uniref:1-acyl-sn-glycerol-3-phosphate acyltransferase n=1 Tax=Calderihabitans maritimus TaxID=1246530 RepID=A0A1Z5HUL1_9FIRM|nr:lysophospholipid acyltransferase family protein [Calderihabitans maritimus]GAW93226.1 1-acyl-sn-glycerol-3-phosphate acyltransferase [Calderihabitans maritimus]
MFYTVAKQIVLLFFRICCRWQVVGKENLPPQGPVVVVANHVSYWDPPVLGVALPRQIHFMAKEELFRIPLLGPLIRILGAFPVKRGKSDRAALKAGLQLLQEGKVLGLFPEGTRSKTGQLLPFQPGAALLALKAGVPIVPVALQGSRQILRRFRPTVRVVIGKPLVFQDLYGQKVSSAQLAEIMEQVREEVFKGLNS